MFSFLIILMCGEREGERDSSSCFYFMHFSWGFLISTLLHVLNMVKGNAPLCGLRGTNWRGGGLYLWVRGPVNVCVCVGVWLCVCTEIKSERDEQQLHRKSTYEWGEGRGAYCGHSVSWGAGGRNYHAPAKMYLWSRVARLPFVW